MNRSIYVLFLAAASFGGCVATTWDDGLPHVSDKAVAAALGDDASAGESADRSALPILPAPHHVRPCCAFGMDMTTKLGDLEIPGYSVSNILEVEDLGRHEYDNGFLTVNQDLGRFVTVETNGLIYTCRGGFIDVAHVRDNADMTLFLATRIVLDMWAPRPVTLEGDGAIRRVVLKPIPPELIESVGPWEVAVTLAQWASYQISIWHEIVTWYGYESVPASRKRCRRFRPRTSIRTRSACASPAASCETVGAVPALNGTTSWRYGCSGA